MKILRFSCLFFLFIPPSSVYGEEDWTKASSVKVIQVGVGKNGVGSGTIIGVDKDGYDVITCCHVVCVWGTHQVQINGQPWDEPIGTTWVEPQDGKRYAAEVRAYHKNCDLALLRVKDKQAKVGFSPIAMKETYEGTEVTKCGYPGGGQRHIQRSRGMGKRRGPWSFGNVEWDTVITSVASQSGDSGGGLFRDKDHQLVGVVWGAANLGDGWKLCAVPVDEIQTFLKRSNWKPKEVEKKSEALKMPQLYTPIKGK